MPGLLKVGSGVSGPLVCPAAASPVASADVGSGPGSTLEGTDTGSGAACGTSTPCKMSRRAKGTLGLGKVLQVRSTLLHSLGSAVFVVKEVYKHLLHG